MKSGIDHTTRRVYRSDMTSDEYVPPTAIEVLAAIDNLLDPPRKCRRHVWFVEQQTGHTSCHLCGAHRDEVRRRRNRNNRLRGGAYETKIAKALGGRRTGPLGGRDDVVVGTTLAVQTKKDLSLSLNKARTYLDDLTRTFPGRTALVIHSKPGRGGQPVVILALNDWVALHGQDGINEGATNE